MTTHGIQVIPDATWHQAVGGTEREALLLTSTRRLLLTALADGPVVDNSGRATLILHERMARLGYKAKPTALNGVLNEAPMAHAIERAIRGKRCFRIELWRIPQRWAHVLPHVEEAPSPSEPPAVEEAPPEAPHVDDLTDISNDATWEEEAPRLDGLRLTVVSALLTRCVDILAAGATDGELDEARRRLSESLAYGERLRRQLADVGDELRSMRQERDGLRQRLRMAEANVERLSAPNGDAARMVREMASEELARVMREAPRRGN